MNGIITIFSKKNILDKSIEIEWKTPFAFQGNYIHRKIRSENILIEQCTSSKFLYEKKWINNDQYLLVTEGVIYNIPDLCKQENVNNFESLIFNYFEKQNNIFFKSFEGNFSGIFYNKKDRYWIAFNNQTGMKKIFYFDNDDYLIFSSDLTILSRSLKKLGIRLTLDEESAYFLLTSGFMHENKTLASEVKQIGAGEWAVYLNNHLKINSYYNLKDIQETTDSKETIIEQLDSLFREAIRLEFEKDKTNNYISLTTMSGGLDSRMTALIAHKMGYDNQILLNFSEKGYADQIIAKQIAESYKFDIKQIELNALSLADIDNNILVNDGQVLYTVCSHFFSTFDKIENLNTGLIHTGMIGDAVMGSYVSKVEMTKSDLSDGLYSKGLLNKSANSLNKSISRYPSDELYKFYNRAFLGINTAFLYFDLIGETTSPFLNSSFLSYAYSIPRKYKFRENIYVEWIRTLHPDIARFTWENIGGRPTNNKYLRSYYRYKRAIIKRLPIHTMWKNNMTPEQLWYDKNERVHNSLDTYFKSHIDLINNHKDLENDMIKLYHTGNITEKAQVLTLLGAYKLLFE